MELPVNQIRMTILRKGKLGQYKRLQIGDIYIGKCWLCESRCLCEELANGHTKHFIDTSLIKLFAEQKQGQKGLWE